VRSATYQFFESGAVPCPSQEYCRSMLEPSSDDMVVCDSNAITEDVD